MNLFKVLFVASLVVLILGFIKPELVLVKKGSRKRIKVFLIYGVISIIFLVLGTIKKDDNDSFKFKSIVSKDTVIIAEDYLPITKNSSRDLNVFGKNKKLNNLWVNYEGKQEIEGKEVYPILDYNYDEDVINPEDYEKSEKNYRLYSFDSEGNTVDLGKAIIQGNKIKKVNWSKNPELILKKNMKAGQKYEKKIDEVTKDTFSVEGVGKLTLPNGKTVDNCLKIVKTSDLKLKDNKSVITSNSYYYLKGKGLIATTFYTQNIDKKKSTYNYYYTLRKEDFPKFSDKKVEVSAPINNLTFSDLSGRFSNSDTSVNKSIDTNVNPMMEIKGKNGIFQIIASSNQGKEEVTDIFLNNMLIAESNDTLTEYYVSKFQENLRKLIPDETEEALKWILNKDTLNKLSDNKNGNFEKNINDIKISISSVNTKEGVMLNCSIKSKHAPKQTTQPFVPKNTAFLVHKTISKEEALEAIKKIEPKYNLKITNEDFQKEGKHLYRIFVKYDQGEADYDYCVDKADGKVYRYYSNDTLKVVSD